MGLTLNRWEDGLLEIRVRIDMLQSELRQVEADLRTGKHVEALERIQKLAPLLRVLKEMPTAIEGAVNEDIEELYEEVDDLNAMIGGLEESISQLLEE